MNSAEKDELRVIICDRIDELTRMLDPASQSALGSSPLDTHALNNATDMSTAVSALAIRELASLRRNLRWLEEEDGGYCEECGCEIFSERLLALPSTRLCVECAGKKEQ